MVGSGLTHRRGLSLLVVVAMACGSWLAVPGDALGEQNGDAPAMPREQEESTTDEPSRPRAPGAIEFERQQDPDDPFPDVPSALMLPVVVVPTAVTASTDVEGSGDVSPSVWVAHALDSLLDFSVYHTRALTPLSGGSLRDALSPYGPDVSTDEVASALGRYYATPLQMGLSIDELSARRIRVTGWVRFDPRYLPEWLADSMPYAVPQEPVRHEIAARTFDLHGDPEALYRGLSEVCVEAVRLANAYATEEALQPISLPLPDWESFLRWVHAYLALDVYDWRTANAVMAPVIEAHPHHAAVALFQANSFAVFQQMFQLEPPGPDLDPQRAAEEMFARLEQVSDELYLAIFDPERTFPLGMLGPTFTDISTRRGMPEHSETVMLKLLEERPGYMRGWSELITQIKLALIGRRYLESSDGIKQIVEVTEEFSRKHPHAWDIRYLLAQVYNAIGRRPDAFALMEELDFQSFSLDPTRTDAFAMAMPTMLGMGTLHGVLLHQTPQGGAASLPKLESVRALSTEYVEATQYLFDLSARTLFTRLDRNRNNRVDPEEAPSLRGFNQSDRSETGNLSSFEALSYYGVLGRGPVEASHDFLTLSNVDRLTENVWSAALALKALTGREHRELDAFLDGYVARQRRAPLQAEADMQLRFLLTEQVDMREDEDAEFVCQRGERVLAALMSWQLSQLLLADAQDAEERAELLERLEPSRERARYVFEHDRVMSAHLQQVAFPQRPQRFAPNPYAGR